VAEESFGLLRHRQEIAGRYADALNGFAALCLQFCKVIDERDEVDTYDFLERLDHFLPLVYAASRLLPLPWEWFVPDEDGAYVNAEPEAVDEDNVERLALETELARELEERLGELNYYTMVFDPYAHRAVSSPDAVPPPLQVSLGADIAAIDAVLRTDLDKFRLNTIGTTFEAAWNWRFELDGGLGNHITNAIRAVWSLVNDHAEDLWEDTSDPDLGV
jgi:hypothetical protein